MLKEVFILQGTSGSGKSTWVKGALSDFDRVKVVSADHVMYSADGVYSWSAEKQREGHRQCLAEFAQEIQRLRLRFDHENSEAIVVDNTNTRALFMAPYVDLARAHDLHVSILSFRAPAALCVTRNAGRAPENVVREMVEAIEQFTLPTHWAEDPGITFTIIDTGLKNA